MTSVHLFKTEEFAPPAPHGPRGKRYTRWPRNTVAERRPMMLSGASHVTWVWSIFKKDLGVHMNGIPNLAHKNSHF
jgi:hypothetical protein